MKIILSNWKRQIFSLTSFSNQQGNIGHLYLTELLSVKESIIEYYLLNIFMLYSAVNYSKFPTIYFFFYFINFISNNIFLQNLNLQHVSWFRLWFPTSPIWLVKLSILYTILKLYYYLVINSILNIYEHYIPIYNCICMLTIKQRFSVLKMNYNMKRLYKYISYN